MRTAQITQTVYFLGDSDVEPTYDLQINLGDLSGPEGNAFMILGSVQKLISKNVSKEAAKRYHEEATAGDYLELLRVTGNTVTAVVSNVPDQYLEALAK